MSYLKRAYYDFQHIHSGWFHVDNRILDFSNSLPKAYELLVKIVKWRCEFNSENEFQNSEVWYKICLDETCDDAAPEVINGNLTHNYVFKSFMGKKECLSSKVKTCDAKDI